MNLNDLIKEAETVAYQLSASPAPPPELVATFDGEDAGRRGSD